MNTRQNSIIVALVSAMLVPKIQTLTGLKLSTEDVAELVAGATLAWHGLTAFIESRFPPKVQAAQPPKVSP
jgi:hypothetical protein